MPSNSLFLWGRMYSAFPNAYGRAGGLSSEERGAASCSAFAGSTRPAPN